MTLRALWSLWSVGPVVALSLLATAGCQRERPAAPAVQIGGAPLDFGGDFTLTNQDGQPFRLDSVRGKAALLFFGYTSCPDMCPMTMSRIMSALKQLGDSAADGGADRGGTRVVTLFVSVDPKRDSPAVLKEYVSAFRTPLVALTGSADEVKRVASLYHASFEYVQTDSPNYLVNHTTAIFLIDPQGRLREYFAYDENPARLAAGLRAVLNGSGT